MTEQVTDSAKLMFALTRFDGIGPQARVSVARSYIDVDALRSDDPNIRTSKIGARVSRNIDSIDSGGWAEALKYAEREICRHLDSSICPIAVNDVDYPPLLRLIDNPPPLLFVSGKRDVLTMPKTVAIVGSRRATKTGLIVATQLATRFAKEHFVIVSGLALGIDTAAHEGALETGRTIAVMATPLNMISPARNRVLAQNITATGALVSEYPLGHKPSRWNFAQRDRIQSGLAAGIVAVQSELRGGTMQTVKFAEQQGRLIFCPEPPLDEADTPSYSGTLALLRSGRAKVIELDGLTVLGDELQRYSEHLLQLPVQARMELG